MKSCVLLIIHLLVVQLPQFVNSSNENGDTKVVTDSIEKLRSRVSFTARSCKDLKDRFQQHENGIYYLSTASGTIYQTFCDMVTAGGGWTLVASVHENNIYGKCTVGDRWSSQQGSDPNVPEGDGNWANRATFGSAESSTSDDYKNPGYYDIVAEDMSVWHVPNNTPMDLWNLAAILRYHTERRFLSIHGGNLHHLFKSFPVRNDAGVRCRNGPSIPIVYDFGDKDTTTLFYGPSTRNQFEPGFLTFRPINNEGAAMAICSGVKPVLINRCDSEHFCIGGSGHFPESAPRQCGDFPGFAWNGYGTNVDWSASKEITEAAVLLFYR